MANIISSRTEQWANYREKIAEQSRLIENPLANKTLAKFVKEIEKIDVNILNNFKNKEIKIPELIKTKDNQPYYFNDILFKIDNFDETTIKKIDGELKLAANDLKSNYIIDDKSHLITLASIDKSDSLDRLDKIEKKIINIESKIQHFPKESKDRLEKLNLLVKTTQKNNKFEPLKPISIEKEITENKKNIVLYLILFGILSFFFVAILVIIILIVIL